MARRQGAGPAPPNASVGLGPCDSLQCARAVGTLLRLKQVHRPFETGVEPAATVLVSNPKA